MPRLLQLFAFVAVFIVASEGQDCSAFSQAAPYITHSKSCLNSTEQCGPMGTLDPLCACACICSNNYAGQLCDIEPQAYAYNPGLSRSFRRRTNSTAFYVPKSNLQSLFGDINKASGTEWTIEFWILLEFSSTWAGKGLTLLETRPARNSSSPYKYDSLLVYSAGKITLIQDFGTSGHFPIFSFPYEFESGVPAHVAITSDNIKRGGGSPSHNRVLTLFINGKYQGEVQGSDIRSFWNRQLFVGTWEGSFQVLSPSNKYTGPPIRVDTSNGLYSFSIDEFRVWRRPRTQTELMETLTVALTGLEQDLILYYNFDNGNETVVPNRASSDPTLSAVFLDDRTGVLDPLGLYSASFSPFTYPIYLPSFIPELKDIKGSTVLFGQRTIGRYSNTVTLPLMYAHSCVAVDDGLYCTGGADSVEQAIPTALDRILVYNVTTAYWTSINAPLNRGLIFHHTFTLGDSRIFALGGDVFSAADLFMFDTVARMWVTAPANNIAETVNEALLGAGHVLDSASGLLWSFGGGSISAGATITPNERMFVLNTMSWKMEEVAKLDVWPAPRMLPCLTMYSPDEILMYGGVASISEKTGYSDLWIFRISERTWSQLTSVNAPPSKMWPSCSAIGSTVALYGGAQGLSIRDALSSTTAGASIAAQSITFFDIKPKDPVPVQFRNIVPTPQAIRPTRFAHSTARIGSKLYVYGGFGVDVKVDPEFASADLVWDDRLIELSLGCDSGYGFDPSSQGCAPCAPGYSQSSSYGFSEIQTCQPCAPGEFQPDYGQSTCLPCPVGFFVDTQGSASCLPCQNGFSTDRPGSNSSALCQNTLSQAAELGLRLGLSLTIIVIVVGVIAVVLIRRRFKQQEKAIETATYGALPAYEFSEQELGNIHLLKRSDLDIGEELGSGSFGTVYRGMYRDKTVAVKVSKPGSREGMLAFLQEAEIMMKLEAHPNIVQLIGVCMTAGSAWVVLEFVDGGSLESLLKRGFQPSEFELRSMVLQLAQGLAHVHKHNLIHRDLACRNVLLMRKDSSQDSQSVDIGKYILKLSDFGMSRIVDAETQRGQTATNFGPVPWMSPEAITMQYSTASDVWSLGVVLWELLTGLDPSRQMPLPDLAVKIRDEGYHPRVAAAWPAWLQQILRGCWAFLPQDRLSIEEVIRIASSASVKQDGNSKYADVGQFGTKPSLQQEVERLREKLLQLERQNRELNEEKVQLLGQAKRSKKKKAKLPDESLVEPSTSANAVELVTFAPPPLPQEHLAPDGGWRRSIAPSKALANTVDADHSSHL